MPPRDPKNHFKIFVPYYSLQIPYDIMFKNHWYWGLCSLGWKVPQNLRKAFERKEKWKPCAWMYSPGHSTVMKNPSFLVSPFFKKVNLREANVKCNKIWPHIYIGEMADSDELVQVSSPLVNYRGIRYGTSMSSRRTQNSYLYHGSRDVCPLSRLC